MQCQLNNQEQNNMKRNAILTFIISLVLFASHLQSQVLLAKWTFPSGTGTDSVADGGIPSNLNKAIHTEGGTSAIDFSKNGATTKAAQATGWDNGSGIKCWVVKITTTGYENLKLSSKMQSGGNSPGPQDYKVQYRIATGGNWTDIPGSAIVTANNWTTGWLDSISVPSELSNLPEVAFRWIMTSNTSSSGGTVASSGINKIDDIYVTGKAISIGLSDSHKTLNFTLSPNPVTDYTSVECSEPIEFITILDINNKVVLTETVARQNKVNLRLNEIQKGVYLLNIYTTNGLTRTKKVVVQ